MMAVVKATIQAQLKTRIQGLSGAVFQDATKLDNFCGALADWIVTDILPTVTVATTVAVTSVSGVTTGGGVSGPGAGTGTGTIS